MIKLWQDPVIREVLDSQRVRLQDEGGLCV